MTGIVAMGELKLLGNNKVEIGGKVFSINWQTYNDLIIANDEEIKKYKWLKVDKLRPIDFTGLYFSKKENEFVVSNMFFTASNRELYLLKEKEEKSVNKNDVFFSEDCNGTVFYITKGGIGEVFSPGFLTRTMKVFGMRKSCVDYNLWKKIKRGYKGGIYAIIDKRLWKHISKMRDLIVWGFVDEIIVEGESEEHINEVVSEVIVNEL